VRIETILDQALDARIQADAAVARADRWKAAAVAEAERLRLTGGLADRFPSSQGLGTLRLDGAGKPAVPSITVPGEFASWLAERRPDAVTATVTVPAGQLAEALAALEFSGVTATAAVTPAAGAVRFLDEACHVQADPDLPGGWLVLHVDDQAHTEPVPGVTAARPQPRWVLTADSSQKKTAVQHAVDETEAALDALDAPPPALAVEASVTVPAPAPARRAGLSIVPDAAPDLRVWTAEEIAQLDRAGLVRLAKAQGLPSSGNKRDLVDRLVGHFTAAATA